MTDEQVARIFRTAPALKGAHQQVASLARDRHEQAKADSLDDIDLDIEAGESRTALGPVSHPRDGGDGTSDGAFPSLLGADTRSERMTTERTLAGSELPEETYKSLLQDIISISILFFIYYNIINPGPEVQGSLNVSLVSISTFFRSGL